MGKRLLSLLMGSLLLMMISSCGPGTAHVRRDRFSRTGMGAQESLVILLARYVNDNKEEISENKEQEISECMKRTMMAQPGELIQTIPGIDFQRTLFPGTTFESAPRSAEALLDRLKEDAVRDRVLAMSVRYIVIVDARTTFSEKSSGPLWGSTTTSKFHATVLDAKYRMKSGELYSDAAGKVGSTLRLLSRTELDACSGMGKAVYDFITSKEDPAPTKGQ